MCCSGQKWEQEGEREIPPLPLTHIQTACTHCCCCCTLAGKQRGHGIKTHSDVWRPSGCRIPQRVGYSERGEPLSRSAARALQSICKQALCSWGRHGYHGNKHKNSNNKGPDWQQAFSDCFRCLRALVLVKQWFPQLHQKGLQCNCDNVASAQNDPRSNTGCCTAANNLIPKGQHIASCHHGGSCAIQICTAWGIAQSKRKAWPGSHQTCNITAG